MLAETVLMLMMRWSDVSDVDVRQFLLGEHVTADGLPAHATERDQDEVQVRLSSGAVHRHLSVDYDRRDGQSKARWTAGSSYAVLPSGALAVTGWKHWSVGWPLGTNDSHSIVVTYAPHSWEAVTGPCEVDPYRDEARERRRQAQRKEEDQATAAAADS